MEDDLRSPLAARAAEVDQPPSLQPGPPARRSAHRWPSALLAVGAVGLLLIGGFAAARQLSDRSTASGTTASGTSSLTAPFDGVRAVGHWQAMKIILGSRTVPVPPKLHVTLDLAANQTLMFDDSINVTSGRYRVTPAGLQVGMLGQTLAGYGGHDPVVNAAQQAVSTVAVGPNKAGPERAIAAALDGDQLTLSSGTASIVYLRDGQVPSFMYATAPATTTPPPSPLLNPGSLISGSMYPAPTSR